MKLCSYQLCFLLSLYQKEEITEVQEGGKLSSGTISAMENIENTYTLDDLHYYESLGLVKRGNDGELKLTLKGIAIVKSLLTKIDSWFVDE